METKVATKEVLNSLISAQNSWNFSCIHMSSMSDMKRVHTFKKKKLLSMEKTVHLKRGTKSLGKHSEYEALVQVKQTVHHSETTARSQFPEKKGKISRWPFWGRRDSRHPCLSRIILIYYYKLLSQHYHISLSLHDRYIIVTLSLSIPIDPVVLSSIDILAGRSAGDGQPCLRRPQRCHVTCHIWI